MNQDEQYRSFFDHAVEGIFRTTPDGQYLAANPMLAQIYGYDSPDHLITALRDISGQLYVDTGRRDEFIRLMSAHNVITNFESRIRRKDGAIIWISENVRAIRNERNDLLYYEGTVADITNRKRLEEQISESEILHHSLVENIPMNILRKDVEGTFTFANQRFCQSMHRQQHEIKGCTDFDLFPKELAEKYRRDDQRVMNSGAPHETVEEHISSTGERSYVHVIKTPLCDTEKRLIGIQCIFWDVTAQRQVEEQLAFERNLLRALLDNVPDRIFFKDTESRFIRCSAALAAVLGLRNPEEAIGRTSYDFFAAPRATEIHEAEQRLILTGKPIVNQVEQQASAAGAPQWESVSKVPIRNRTGIVTGLIGISRDITALKQAEEDLAKARDLANENARLKARFLATMSHEIRTPMNAIIGMIDLLLDTSLDMDQRDYARQIHTSAEALLGILNDVLDYSKMDAGRLELEAAEFNLRELVEDATDLNALQSHAKHIELACHFDPQCAAIYKGDAGRLRQVLLNLVSNAIKFTEAGFVRVVVAADSTSGQVRFEVCDSGIGIPAEAQQMIFDAFRQADGSTTRRYGGTGLGLTISRELVSRMGGVLAVESAPGNGSTFSFQLPLEKVAPSHTPAAHALAGSRAMIVAGDAFARQVMQLHCREIALHLDEAANGADAKHCLAHATPDVVWIDLDLPDMDGLDLVQWIKEQPHLQQARLILMAPVKRKPAAAMMGALRISAVLPKPISHRRFMQALADTNALPAAQELPPITKASRALRILVVDDNPINQRVAQLQLEKLGHSAALCDSGGQTMQLPLQDFDLILMDCQMPGMDGLETTRAIRARESNTATKSYIIAMTANTRPDDRRDCLEAGMNDFIGKPVQLPELRQAIERALENGLHISGRAGVIVPNLSPDILREIAPLFFQQAQEHLIALQQATDTGDVARIKQVAHQMKGTSANLGFAQLASHSAKLEVAAAQGDLDGICQLLNQLPAEIAQAQVSVTECLQS